VSEQDNVAVVQGIYEAFGRGDIPGVLAAMSGDFEMHLPGPSAIPFFGIHRGQAGMGRFFATIAETTEITEFAVDDIVAQGDKVVALGHERAKAKATGRGWETEWAMVWTVRDGKATRLQEYHETAAIAAAFA
jgi:ketosteroid isomerase-like protein